MSFQFTVVLLNIRSQFTVSNDLEEIESGPGFLRQKYGFPQAFQHYQGFHLLKPYKYLKKREKNMDKIL